MDSAALAKVAFFVCIAAAAIILVETLYLAVMRPVGRKRSINRRLGAIAGGAAGEQALVRIKEKRGILDKNLEKMGGLSKLFVQSGLNLTLGRFMLLSVALILVVFFAVRVLSPWPDWVCFGLSLALGSLIPLQVVRFIRSRRQAKFSAQLPDALDVVVRSLKSGHPVPTALGLVSREMPDPIGSEFGIALDELTYGLDMPRVLVNLSERVGVADLSLLVTAVSIQWGTGGNLSEVLGNLSKVLRERFQLRRKVRSLSAEGRFSAYGLVILPIMIFFAIYLPNPKYYTEAWEDPVFKVSIVAMIVWSAIGNYITYKLVNFKF